MITICLNEADFEYDIHSLVKAFYPAEDVKVFADAQRIEELERECTPLFRLEVYYCRGSAGRVDGEGSRISEEVAVAGKGSRIREEVAVAGKGSRIREENAVDEIHILLREEIAGGCRMEERQSPCRTEIKADFSNRGDTKNRLKRCLYGLLSDYSGQTLPWGTLTGIRPTKIPMSMFKDGRDEADIRTYMSEAYLASEQKINLSMEIARREMELLNKIDYEDGYSLYVGIPFCPSICSYCSFSSSPIGLWEGRADDYLMALEKEIDYVSYAFRHSKLNTVYIGGGTPTTLTPGQLQRLLDKIQKSFDFSYLLEYTVEAGRPDSITRDKLDVLREHNISRISINPQTMKQETLDIIGRRHTVEQTVESFLLAREMGFDNINMDLIVGLPEETAEDVRHTMEKIWELSPDNLTVHSLALKRAARLRMFPEDYAGMKMENTWEIIELTADYARKMGLEPYYLYRQKNMAGNFENVGYARPGKAGLYNILIMEEVQSIAALGAGSITKLVHPEKGIKRCENVKDVAQYIGRIDEMIERKKQYF